MENRHSVALVMLAVFAAFAPTDAAPIDVYVIAGQSNTESGFYTEIDPAWLTPQASLLNFLVTVNTTTVESADWGAMEPRRGRFYGPDLSFAKAMEQRTGHPIAVIKTCVAGTGLWNNWLPSLENLYPWMLNKVDSALDQLAATGYEPDLAGFLWVQGENDAGHLEASAEYGANLATLAAAVRQDLNAPTLPFVLNELSSKINRYDVYKEQVRTGQHTAAAADPYMEIVNIDDLDLKADMVHFTGPTHIELGRRFADVFAPSGDFDDDGFVDGDDLAAWKLAAGNTRVGDGNADGVADGADFLLWQRQLQPAAPPGSAVPEPSAIALAAVMLLASRAGRQGRRQQESRVLGQR